MDSIRAEPAPSPFVLPVRIRPVLLGLVQQLVVLLGSVATVRRWLHAFYTLGLRTVMARLTRHPAVHSIYGCGSFFTGSCLYGHSDIDLVIVLGESVPRNEGLQEEIARTYRRVQRFFPFLGRWDEKAANLIFLDEVRTGFPLLESFRLRLKEGRLIRLWGEPFPLDLGADGVTASELMAEVDALLRLGALSGGTYGRKLLFWKRTFSKLRAQAEALGLRDLARAMAAEEERTFGTHGDRTLFFRAGEPVRLFSRLLEASRELWTGVEARSERVTVCLERSGIAPDQAREVPARVGRLLAAAGLEGARARALPPPPLGLPPRLFYFPLDTPLTVVDVDGPAYPALQRVLRVLRRLGRWGDALVVRAEGVLFVLSRQRSYVDLVPLNPLVHANVHAWLAGETAFTMPAPILGEQRAEAAQLFEALKGDYTRHEGWIPKLSLPCVYREDELDTIRNAFLTLRAHAAHVDRRALLTDDELIEFYRQRHPECAAFLEELQRDLRFHLGEADRRPVAPNLHRCLHQFMAGVLGGARHVTLDDHRRGLGITVGIITRNRADHLREALGSLTHQVRRPEEVLVVDNGSTDGTRAVVESFTDRLPLRYLFLADASIPRARNLVIENATQEVIAFTDDDCAAEPEWLVAVERGFMRAANVGIVGGWVLHWPAPQPTTVDTYYGMLHHNAP